MEPPPDILPRGGRQHHRTRPERLQIGNSRSSDLNRVSITPASPEVISSLITSLSAISASTKHHFEDPHLSPGFPVSPALTQTTFGPVDGQIPKKPEGSFGVDYGAFVKSSIQELDEESLDNLAAPPPSIRTSKPPSGFSSLTANKSPAKDTKFFAGSKSRPSSIGSSVSKDHDDHSSIGDLSIEPGKKVTHELKRRSSVESWEKKQARNSKGLKYMSSKEQLREKDARKRASAGTSPHPLDRLSLPVFDSDSFMSTVITEEEGSTESPAKDLLSPNVGPSSPRMTPSSPSTINNRFVPSRDSSLRNRNSTGSKKRSSHRTSRTGNDEEVGGKSIPEGDERQEQKRDRNGKERSRSRVESTDRKSNEPDYNPAFEMPAYFKASSLASKQVVESAKVDEQLLFIDEEGAPSPAVAQRREVRSDKRSSSKNNKNNNRNVTPEPTESMYPKRNSSRLKRLSAPTSPPRKEKEQNRNTPQKGHAISPEPLRPMVHVDERPSSADSIDDAVDAYLRSPRLSQKIKHPQTGRAISFSEVGDSEGFAVFCCVGMGLTRYITAFYDELALTLKLRLITPDRPGVGESEAYADGTATPLSWPDDVYAICQTLKITKFSILAHSAGAIYALATALRMPQHIRGRIHLLAPWIPPSQMNTFGAQNASPPANSMPTSQRILRALPTPILKAANSSFMSATSSSITSSLPRNQKRSKRKSILPVSKDMPAIGRDSIALGVGKENRPRDSLFFPNPNDRNTPSQLSRNTAGGNGPKNIEDLDPNSEAAILAAAAQTLSSKERQAHYDTRLTHAIWDLATTNANPAVDLLVCLERRHTIGFRYVDITRAVVIHHGSRDTRVPVENVKWLGKTMRRCEVRVLEGEGHGLMASAGVMGGVLMEIAKEWEDWMRVVNKKDVDSREGRGRERSGTGVGGSRDWGI